MECPHTFSQEKVFAQTYQKFYYVTLLSDSGNCQVRTVFFPAQAEKFFPKYLTAKYLFVLCRITILF